MDPKFLEWLGQMMLLSARNMEEADRFFKWFREGLPDTKEAEQWIEPYLSFLPQGKEKATKELRKLLDEFFSNMGIVSRVEYEDLKEKYERLEREQRKLEEDIQELKDKMQQERKKGWDISTGWINLIKEMSQSNLELYKSFQKAFFSIEKEKEKK